MSEQPTVETAPAGPAPDGPQPSTPEPATAGPGTTGPSTLGPGTTGPGTLEPGTTEPSTTGPARRRSPDVLTLVTGLVCLVVALMAITGWSPDISFDPRWILAGGAVAVGTALLVSSIRSNG